MQSLPSFCVIPTPTTPGMRIRRAACLRLTGLAVSIVGTRDALLAYRGCKSEPTFLSAPQDKSDQEDRDESPEAEKKHDELRCRESSPHREENGEVSKARPHQEDEIAPAHRCEASLDRHSMFLAGASHVAQGD